MPRISLSLPYQVVPDAPSPAFPGQFQVHLPLIEVALQSGSQVIRVLGLIDTGASMVLFPTQIADALGVDWRNAPTTPVTGVGVPLLGHRGFLDHCKVSFNTAGRSLHIQL